MEQSIKGILKLYKNDELDIDKTVKLINALFEDSSKEDSSNKQEQKKEDNWQDMFSKLQGKIFNEIESMFSTSFFATNKIGLDDLVKMFVTKIKHELNKKSTNAAEDFCENWGNQFEEKLKDFTKKWSSVKTGD
jgi:hypothetical protein